MISEKEFIELLDREKKLSKEEEKNIFIYYKKDPSAENRNRIVNKNLGLINYVITHFYGNYHGEESEDMFQDGVFGLFRAIEKFDIDMDTKFSTYAIPWIRQMIGRGIDSRKGSLRVPTHVCERIKKMEKIINRHIASLGEKPDIDKLAQEMGTDREEIRELLMIQEIHTATYLDAPIKTNDGREPTSFQEIIPDKNSEQFFAQIDNKSLLDHLYKKIEYMLSAKELDVIKRRIGMSPYEKPQTLSEIGKVYGLTKERIRQIEFKAKKKMQSPRIQSML